MTLDRRTLPFFDLQPAPRRWEPSDMDSLLISAQPRPTGSHPYSNRKVHELLALWHEREEERATAIEYAGEGLPPVLEVAAALEEFDGQAPDDFVELLRAGWIRHLAAEPMEVSNVIHAGTIQGLDYSEPGRAHVERKSDGLGVRLVGTSLREHMVYVFALIARIQQPREPTLSALRAANDLAFAFRNVLDISPTWGSMWGTRVSLDSRLYSWDYSDDFSELPNWFWHSSAPELQDRRAQYLYSEIRRGYWPEWEFRTYGPEGDPFPESENIPAWYSFEGGSRPEVTPGYAFAEVELDLADGQGWDGALGETRNVIVRRRRRQGFALHADHELALVTGLAQSFAWCDPEGLFLDQVQPGVWTFA